MTKWGLSEDKPVPADYDGDGKADLAVFRPSDSVWYLYLSTTQEPEYKKFGLANDVPSPGDYDGDGRSDIAVFRTAEGKWLINHSTEGNATVRFGMEGDRPVK